MQIKKLFVFVVLCMATLFVPIKAQAIDKCFSGGTTGLVQDEKGVKLYYGAKTIWGNDYNVLEFDLDAIGQSGIDETMRLYVKKLCQYAVDKNDSKIRTDINGIYVKGDKYSLDRLDIYNLKGNDTFIFMDVNEIQLNLSLLECDHLYINSKNLSTKRRYAINDIKIEGDVDSSFFELVSTYGKNDSKGNPLKQHIEFYAKPNGKKTYNMPSGDSNSNITVYGIMAGEPGYMYTLESDRIGLKEFDITTKYIKMWSNLDDYDRKLTIERKKYEHTCIVNTNGGTPVDGKSIRKHVYTMHYNDVIPNLPTLKRTGYIFKGWKLGYDANAKSIKGGERYTALSKQDFVAQWEAKKVKITFDYADETTKPVVITAEYDKKFNLPKTPTRSGYVFLGWMDKNKKTYKAANCIVDFENDTVITAMWRKSEGSTIKADVTTEAPKPTVTAKTDSTTQTYTVTIKAKKVKGAKGYQFQLCSSKKFKKKSGVALYKSTSKKNKSTIKGIKNSGTYYCRYRSYKKKGKKKSYSKWSKVRKVTVK